MTFIPKARIDALASDLWLRYNLIPGFDIERLLDHLGLDLTGNNHHLEGSNQLPPAARLRGLRVTCLKYGE